jgi:hypothetical protein
MPPTPKPVKPVPVLLPGPGGPARPGTVPVVAGDGSGLTGAVAVLPAPAGDGLRPLVPSSVAPKGMPELPIGEREAVPPNTEGNPVLPKVEPGPIPPVTPLTCAAAEPSISNDTAAVLTNKNLIAIFLSV